jgi:hypothetical protein
MGIEASPCYSTSNQSKPPSPPFLSFNSMDETEKKKRKREDVAERIARNKGLNFTTIKTGFEGLCKDAALAGRIQECVTRCSRIAVEASLLASFHVLRLIEQCKYSCFILLLFFSFTN